MRRISVWLLIAVLVPVDALAQRKWYGGANLPNGTGESIFDTSGQWMPFGGSVRLGATDSGHTTGILVLAQVTGTITNIYTKAVSNSWNSGGSWALSFEDCGTDPEACASPSNTSTTIGYDDTISGPDSDTSASITVTAGRAYQWKWTRTGGGSGDLRIPFLSYIFTPTSGDSFQLSGGEKYSLTTASSTLYAPPFGDNTFSTEINSSRIKILFDGTVTAFAQRVFSNLRVTDTTFALQLNGSDIGSGVTFSSLEIGYEEDPGYGTPVAVVNGDYLSLRTTTSTGTLLMEVTTPMVTFNPTTSTNFQIGVTSGAGLVVTQGTTRYFPVMGDLTVVTTVDGNAEMMVPFNMSLDRCRGYIRANSLGGGQTLTVSLRVDGSAVRTMTWSSGSGAAEATFSDSTAVSLTAGQEVDFVATATAGSGTAQLMNVECRGVDQATASTKKLTLLGVGAQ